MAWLKFIFRHPRDTLPVKCKLTETVSCNLQVLTRNKLQDSRVEPREINELATWLISCEIYQTAESWFKEFETSACRS